MNSHNKIEFELEYSKQLENWNLKSKTTVNSNSDSTDSVSSDEDLETDADTSDTLTAIINSELQNLKYKCKLLKCILQLSINSSHSFTSFKSELYSNKNIRMSMLFGQIRIWVSTALLYTL